MDSELEQELLESYDELSLVAQITFQLCLENDLFPALEAHLFANNVKPGFAERCEAVRKRAMRDIFRRDVNAS